MVGASRTKTTSSPLQMMRRRWVVLSPHLDDAVLSCGGLIAAMRNQVKVEIWSLFSGAPFRGPYSPVAQWLHGVSGGSTGSRLAWRRRREDRAACRVLGARCRHFMWKDAVYRKAADSSFMYDQSQQETWHIEDDHLAAAMTDTLLRNLTDSDVLLVPLGLGRHVDHLIVRHAAEQARHSPLLYYPDLPYLQRYPHELGPLASNLKGLSYVLSAEHIRAWVAAVQLYSTQMAMLEEAAGPIPELIENFASRGRLELYCDNGAASTRSADLGFFLASDPSHSRMMGQAPAASESAMGQKHAR
jgi:LmbE family N-acetylglucosaminyl deacetylase